MAKKKPEATLSEKLDKLPIQQDLKEILRTYLEVLSEQERIDLVEGVLFAAAMAGNHAAAKFYLTCRDPENWSGIPKLPPPGDSEPAGNQSAPSTKGAPFQLRLMKQQA